ncbi:c-type cytochrome [Rhizobium paknamense]|uniref:Cytochrome c n=1 Tax=Rhizobium paknamense TaxID=1206817 RepID=A0ABU0I9G7_9HYPH|nr:cytochrome c family protein [Rhizobium paknamense]MDQ0454870.1 cytochrome c [Rhizobium paknamense]
MKLLLVPLIALPTLMAPSLALADGDAAKGEIVFRKCAACHNIDQPENKIGPHLTGILGRKVASVSDYTNYSEALKQAGTDGAVWDETSIAAWVTDPKKLHPGNRMSFTGLKKPEDVADLIAYLKSKQGQ